MNIFSYNDSYYPPVKEDLEREANAPTIAEQRGCDVVVVRVGPSPIKKEMVKLASEAIRKSANNQRSIE